MCGRKTGASVGFLFAFGWFSITLIGTGGCGRWREGDGGVGDVGERSTGASGAMGATGVTGVMGVTGAMGVMGAIGVMGATSVVEFELSSE